MKKIQVSKTALDAFVVHNFGEELVHGIKTFTSSPKVPTLPMSSNDTSAASTSWVKTVLNSDLDADVVHKTGAEVVNGIKTFTSSPKVPTLPTSSNDTSAANTSWVKTLLNSATVAIPDVSSQVLAPFATILSGYTAPSNGIVRFVFNLNDISSYDITINGVSVYSRWARSYGGHSDNMWFPVKKSDVIKCNKSDGNVLFAADFIPFTTI